MRFGKKAQAAGAVASMFLLLGAASGCANKLSAEDQAAIQRVDAAASKAEMAANKAEAAARSAADAAQRAEAAAQKCEAVFKHSVKK